MSDDKKWKEYTPFYDDEREYVMTDKRKYTEVLASLEVHFQYINNHLGNIDKHLDRLNNRVRETEDKTTKNTTNIKWLIRILIGAGIISGGGIGVAQFFG